MASKAGACGGGSVGGVDSDCEGEEPEDSSSLCNDVLAVNNALDQLCLQDDTQKTETEDELSLFRQQWQRELESTPTPQQEPQPQLEHQPQPEPEPVTEEEKAKQLFRQGVELERGGQLYEAIQHYKRAMQILPDVEARLYESTDLREDTPEVESALEERPRLDNAEESEDEDAVEGEELLARLQRILARRGALCEQEFPARGGHISWLPFEVILLILRWVVSSELDAASLDRVALVSRGLYVASRDPDLWRALCLGTWGIECGNPRSLGFQSWRHMYVERPRLQLNGCYISKTTYLRHGENSFQDQFYRPWYLVDYYRYLSKCGNPRGLGFQSWRHMYVERPRLQLNGCYISKTTYLRHGENSFQDQFYRPWYLVDYYRYLSKCGNPRSLGFQSWRHMYVERPRLQLNGCYISKTTYLRHGENSFQDQFYRPWYLVDYYRYLRFFPEGLVLMLTTPDEPASSVTSLKHRLARPGQGIMPGHYRLMGDKVVIVIKKTGSEKKITQASNTRFRARRKDSHEQLEQTFHMEFELRNVRSRRNFQLCWRRYSVCARRDQWTQFELSPSKFPPLSFSRVRNYTAEASAPLRTAY